MHQAGHVVDSMVVGCQDAGRPKRKLFPVVGPDYYGYHHRTILLVSVAAGSMGQHGNACIIVVVHGTSSTLGFPCAACIWADIGKLYLPDLSTTSFRAEIGFQAKPNVATDLAGLDLCKVPLVEYIE